MGKSYLANPLLKKCGIVDNFTPDQIAEYATCARNPLYFLSNYVKIITLDQGLVGFNPYKYQIELTKLIIRNRYTIAKWPRQSGKTTILSGIMLWLILFHDQYSIALLAHKAAQAREILTRIKLAYENVPLWMQQGVKKWNEGNIELENGASVIAAATSSSAIRGQSINMVYLDEFAFVPNHIADKFFTSVLPTISAGKETKIVITSTPFGLNLFYKLWHDAEQGRNDYQRLAVNWWDTPGRDDKWKKEQIRLFGGDERKFLQEYSCLDGSSIITIRNKKTGIVEQIPIVTCYSRLNSPEPKYLHHGTKTLRSLQDYERRWNGVHRNIINNKPKKSTVRSSKKRAVQK